MRSTLCGEIANALSAIAEKDCVSQSNAARSPPFPQHHADQDVPMNIDHFDYAQLSEDAMAAADRAVSVEECQTHLARAVRYASLACIQNQRSPDFNVVEIRPGVRQQF
jgi:hypothetical protein